MSFLSFGPVNLSQVNQPFVAGPNVNTTLTNKPAGPYFSERQYLKALEIRKSLRKKARPPRQLTDLEKAEARLIKAENAIRSLPYVFYGKDTIANMAHDELREARESLNDLLAAQDRRNAIDEAKARIRAALDARKKQ